MEAVATRRSHKNLFMNTLAFTVCFAAWMLNGVLVTFLIDNQVFDWSPVQFGWLMALPSPGNTISEKLISIRRPPFRKSTGQYLMIGKCSSNINPTNRTFIPWSSLIGEPLYPWLKVAGRMHLLWSTSGITCQTRILSKSSPF